MILLLLPLLPTSEMLESIVAFRIVYYAIPAPCSLHALIRPFTSSACEPSLAVLHPTKSNQAEVQIITQNGGRILPTLDDLSAIWSTSQTITAVFNPISSNMDAALSAYKTKQPVWIKSRSSINVTAPMPLRCVATAGPSYTCQMMP